MEPERTGTGLQIRVWRRTAGLGSGVRSLEEMVGQKILVHVIYLVGGVEQSRLEFMGSVTAVSPMVTVERPGDKPFTLPPDLNAYGTAAPGAYTLSTGEVVMNPRYETTWRVKPPVSGARPIPSDGFHPGARPHASVDRPHTPGEGWGRGNLG